DDDGLLLNFAAPTASSSKVQQQPRRSQGKNNGRRVASAVTSAPTEKKTEQPTSGPSPKTQPRSASASLHSRKEQNGGREVQSSSQKAISRSTSLGERNASKTASGATSSTSKQSSAPKSTRGTAVISSLFAGSDALQETKEKEEKQQRYDPTNAPSKVSDFGSLQLDPLLVAHLKSEKMKITRPTGIQKTALPFLLSSSSFERDALLHAQTGSGKTLCYLLPIIQSLLPFCQSSWIDRSCLGTLAIILAPTRELARQIYEVVESLCSLHLAAKSTTEEDSDEQDSAVRRTRWIVPGLLSGGATKNHEKSRLRKGLPIIVATPGRLLDHLRNTAALDVGRLQWLVLDEADRLLQLGFEETLNDILKAIDARRRAACELQRQRMRDELGNQFTGQTFEESEILDTFGEAWWRHNRRTILCSATLDEGVQVLAGKSLHDPKLIRSDASKEAESETEESTSDGNKNAAIAAPAQLSQYYVIVPTKQRLIILLALLRRSISMSNTAKIMVFLSCTDSVDYHLAAMSGVTMARVFDDNAEDEEKEKNKIEYTSQLLPSTSLFKLHGSLTAQARQASLKAFSQSKQASILFCTSVASRGLDLHVSHVIQVDPPTEKGADEYVHRIGRTARAGEIGESWLMVLPNEEECIQHYETAIGKEKGVMQRREPVSILRDGFGGSDLVQTQTRATDAQMALERWTVSTEERTGMARRAYLAHLRAYATHPPSERHIFAIAKLQLGHLAKAFSLREAPGEIRAK
ncbi:DEAD-domain-containing protein, partial [Meira miltonrushii]